MQLQDSTLHTAPSTLQAVVILLMVLNCFAIGLRLYTRHFLNQRLKIDDWFALTGYSFVLALSIYFSVGISERLVGYPVPPDFTGETYDPIVTGALRHFYISTVIIFPTLFFTKSTIVLFYRRVLVADTRNFRDINNIVTLLALVIVTLWSLVFGFTWAFACNPVRGFWSWPYGSNEGPCLDTWMLNEGISISDCVLDVAIFLIPIPLVWKLHLPAMRKVAVLTVFFLGVIAVAASILRLTVVLWAMSSEGAATADGLLVNTTVLFWSIIECHLCLLAACLPTLRGLLKTRLAGRLIQSYRSRTWFTSRSRSTKSGQSKSGGSDHGDGLPLTNLDQASPVSEYTNDKKYPHDVTLVTLDSVATNEDESAYARMR